MYYDGSPIIYNNISKYSLIIIIIFIILFILLYNKTSFQNKSYYNLYDRFRIGIKNGVKVEREFKFSVHRTTENDLRNIRNTFS